MGVSKTVVAICGASGTGKSSVSRVASNAWGWPLRECGEEIKAYANDMGISFSDVPIEKHRDIDGQTRAWLRNQSANCLLDGRFLHYVLNKNIVDVKFVLVRLQTDFEVRAQRLSVRMGQEISPAAVIGMDEADAKFCNELYDGDNALIPNIIVNNTHQDINETFEAIHSFLLKN